MSQLIGEITQIIGPVIDISFETAGTALPSIHDALEIEREDDDPLIVECQQHIGENYHPGHCHGFYRRIETGNESYVRWAVPSECRWVSRSGAGC